MSSENLMQLLLRLLPSIVVFGLAFWAGSDQKTRERWSDLLYQLGSVRFEQRFDPKIQRGVRLPFFILAVIFLIWPIRYYLHATRTIEITAQSDLMKKATNVSDLSRGNTSGNAVTNQVTGNSATTASNTLSPPNPPLAPLPGAPVQSTPPPSTSTGPRL